MAWLVREGPTEKVKRMHVSFRRVEDALSFLRAWSVAQSRCTGQQATCLFECGPAVPLLRKPWVDIDGTPRYTIYII